MINIAIDGPAGAGKSSIAKSVAKDMGYIYVDTGALYRAVGVNALNNNIDTKNNDLISKMLPNVCVELKFINGEQRVFLNQKDVSVDIRTPEVSMAASNVSAIPSVREFLFDLQRDIASKNNCIMDGRDIGTVVLPNADIKFFVTASVEERANRRYNELKSKNISVNYNDVLEEMKVRDFQDSNREIAPLKTAEDSIIIDTTEYQLQEVVDKIEALVREKINERI